MTDGLQLDNDDVFAARGPLASLGLSRIDGHDCGTIAAEAARL